MADLLLINDMAGYGKVALSAMVPILSGMGHQVHNLPTALVSNTLDYGKFHILDTTDYMRSAISVWDELGFHFDIIATGFLVSEEQTGLVSDYCRRKKAEGAFIFVDPIMGDDGRLYPGVTENTIAYMRQMCAVADTIVPNFTEAAFLAGKYQDRASLTREEAHDLIRTLHAGGARTVVITSMHMDGTPCTLVLDGESGEITALPYEEIPVRFPGTGDIFSSVLLGQSCAGKPLLESVQAAMDGVARLITDNRDNEDKYRGIPIERYLDLLRK